MSTFDERNADFAIARRDDDLTAEQKLKCWGPGPWVHEPNHMLWRAHGLLCIAHRNPVGAWCGYVGLPKGHPLHGKHYSDIEGVEAHGGLTYTRKCEGPICHTPAPGESDDVWWIGFDCCHCYDLAPAFFSMNRLFAELQSQLTAAPPLKFMGHAVIYRDLAYVRAETEALAAQCAEYVQ